MHTVPPLLSGGHFHTRFWQQSMPFVPGNKSWRIQQMFTWWHTKRHFPMSDITNSVEGMFIYSLNVKLTASSLAGGWLSFSIFSSLFCWRSYSCRCVKTNKQTHIIQNHLQFLITTFHLWFHVAKHSTKPKNTKNKT